MKSPTKNLIVFGAIATACVFGACSKDEDDRPPSGLAVVTATTGGGDTSGSTGSGGSGGSDAGSGGSQAATGGSGGAPSCIDVLDGGCGDCMELLCCDEISACLADAGCKECLVGSDLECNDPTASALNDAVFACSKQFCQDQCFSGGGDVYSCNPITNAGCDGANDFVCDADLLNGAFICTGPPHTQQLCEACGPQDGFCAAGLSCVGNKCRRYCCDAGDCGPGALCDKSYFAGVGMGEVGVCTDSQNTLEPDCSGQPATPPSGGSCVPFSG